MFAFRFLGLTAATRAAQNWPGRLAKGISDAIRASAFILERDAKIALTTGPTRAIDTGRLRESTKVQSLSDVRAEIYPTVNYAIYVHEGTKFMRERPFLKRAIEVAMPKIRAAFKDRIKTSLSWK